MTFASKTRLAATAVLTGLSLLLSGCFINPGKFTSELVLEKGDRFSFTYEGEIFFMALSSLAQMGAAADEEFVPQPCYVDATDEVRKCSPNERSAQRAAWEAGAQERAAKAKREAEQMAAFMGGIDPSDPEATREMIRLLERQKGWESVVDKGDGLFKVRYAINGQLGHDFMFPLIEGFPTTNPFVQIIVRNDNVMRVNAPGFAAQGEGGPMGGGLGALIGLAAMSEGQENGPEMPNVPEINGTFTIVTNGEIRANNTDDGATQTARGKQLTWNITTRTQNAPTALIDLSQ